MIEYTIKKDKSKLIRDFDFKDEYNNKKIKSIILYTNLRISGLIKRLTEN